MSIQEMREQIVLKEKYIQNISSVMEKMNPESSAYGALQKSAKQAQETVEQLQKNIQYQEENDRRYQEHIRSTRHPLSRREWNLVQYLQEGIQELREIHYQENKKKFQEMRDYEVRLHEMEIRDRD